MGAKLPKGILIYGEPGIGKTMLAEAFIKECNVKTFKLVKNKDNSGTLLDIRKTYQEASEEDIAIVFIDDIDKFASLESNDRDKDAFVAIQASMDSVKHKNILTIATANSYQKLPLSLKRSGRFDSKIALTVPSGKDAEKIIRYYLSTKQIDENINIDDVSKMIKYKSCADLQSILNDSAINATYLKKDRLDIHDILEAYLKREFGRFDDEEKIDENTLRSISYHEAGHAIVAEILKPGNIGLISVDQSCSQNRLQGFTKMCELFKRRPENILVDLAGKAAVELFLEGRCGSGCNSDLESAVRLIKDGAERNATYGTSFLFPSEYSDTENLRTSALVSAELERFMFLVKDILIKNKDFYFKLVDELIKKKTLFNSDIKKIRDSVTVYDKFFI